MRSCWWWTRPPARTPSPRPASSTRRSAAPDSCWPSATAPPRAAGSAAAAAGGEVFAGEQRAGGGQVEAEARRGDRLDEAERLLGSGDEVGAVPRWVRLDAEAGARCGGSRSQRAEELDGRAPGLRGRKCAAGAVARGAEHERARAEPAP